MYKPRRLKDPFEQQEEYEAEMTKGYGRYLDGDPLEPGEITPGLLVGYRDAKEEIGKRPKNDVEMRPEE